MLDGIKPTAPAGLGLAVRNRGGNPGMAVDLTTLAEIAFAIPVCRSGTLALDGKTLSATVLFDGGELSSNEQYYVAGALGFHSVFPRTLTTLSAPLTGSVVELVVKAGTFGAPFAGTIWFDDLEIR